MPNFAILGGRTSQSARQLAAELDIQHLYSRVRPAATIDFVINYGYRGNLLAEYYRRFPGVQEIPTFNRGPVPNKFRASIEVNQAGVPIPRVYDHHPGELLEDDDILDAFLFKPYFSQRGRGIIRATEQHDISTGYYQEFIRDRHYETRVVGATWMPQNQWAVWKKLPGQGMDRDQIAWNHDQGGIFRRVRDTSVRVFAECIRHSATVLQTLGLQFGAVDFIVHGEQKLVKFLEVNTRPGFSSGYGAEFYIPMFRQLLEKNHDELSSLLATPRGVVEQNTVANTVPDPPREDPAIRMERIRSNLLERLGGIMQRWQQTHETTYHGNLEEIADRIIANTTV